MNSRTVYPLLFYRDAPAAIEFLERAFGFERWLVVPGDEGIVIHSELGFGKQAVLVSSATNDASRARVGLGAVYLRIDDVDAMFTQAAAAGVAIVKPPYDTDYGSRDFTCRDPEGNDWYFGTYRPAAPTA